MALKTIRGAEHLMRESKRDAADLISRRRFPRRHHRGGTAPIRRARLF